LRLTCDGGITQATTNEESGEVKVRSSEGTSEVNVLKEMRMAIDRTEERG
jgi:hypothetical protein